MLYVLDHCLSALMNYSTLSSRVSAPSLFLNFPEESPKDNTVTTKIHSKDRALSRLCSVFCLNVLLACFPYWVNRRDVLKNGHATVVHVITMNGVYSLEKFTVNVSQRSKLRVCYIPNLLKTSNGFVWGKERVSGGLLKCLHSNCIIW